MVIEMARKHSNGRILSVIPSQCQIFYEIAPEIRPKAKNLNEFLLRKPKPCSGGAGGRLFEVKSNKRAVWQTKRVLSDNARNVPQEGQIFPKKVGKDPALPYSPWKFLVQSVLAN